MLCYTHDSNIVTLIRKEANMQELISKKELLEKYGISYGTLYRWKRMGLIPEEWLVKKSTFTGQETFFNRELICRRVEEILAKKDSVPLEELARQLVEKRAESPTVKVTTKYGDAVFYLSDITDITVSANGGKTSILEAAKIAAEQH